LLHGFGQLSGEAGLVGKITGVIDDRNLGACSAAEKQRKRGSGHGSTCVALIVAI
jgi:hypothetical protein